MVAITSDRLHCMLKSLGWPKFITLNWNLHFINELCWNKHKRIFFCCIFLPQYSSKDELCIHNSDPRLQGRVTDPLIIRTGYHQHSVISFLWHGGQILQENENFKTLIPVCHTDLMVHINVLTRDWQSEQFLIHVMENLFLVIDVPTSPPAQVIMSESRKVYFIV